MDKTRVGLIGAGRMGQLYARIVNESGLGQVVALVGNSPAKTQEAARSLDVPGYAEGDTASLWGNHELDAVIVATPEWEHLQPSLETLERGLPLLLEKPMTHNLEEAESIFRAAEGHLVMLCHVLRFDDRYAALRERVQQGQLGDIQYIYARRSADQNAYRRIHGRCHSAYWLSPHDVDQIRWITGAEVTRVFAHGIKDGTAPIDGIFMDLWLSNGAVARIENTWTAPALNGVWRWCLLEVEGTEGRAEIVPSEQGFMVYRSDGIVETSEAILQSELHGRVRGAFASLVQHFLQVVRGEAEPIMNAKDGLVTVRVAAAAERSIREGRIVEMAEIA
jgi:UDP-N-acetylglucosamine 3-dehydrogenase